MRGLLRPSPWIQHQFFPSYTRKLSQFTLLSFFFLFFFLAKMAWNAIVCETTDVSREDSIFPIVQKTWFQAILAKKKTEKKRKSPYEDFIECEDLAECVDFTWFYSMCTSLAVECDALAGARRICGMRRIPSMRGWYRDHIGKFRGQNQNSNPKASPNFQGHTSGFYFCEFTLGEVPGKKLANFYSANL